MSSGKLFGLWLLWIVVPVASVVRAEASPDGIEFFEKHVRPILVERCYECHSNQAGEANGELVVDSRAGMEKGGTRGSILNREAPDKSLLLHAVEYNDAEVKMPPDGRMPDTEVAVLKRWVEMGAPDPRTDAPVAGSKFDPMSVKLEKAVGHWAYQAPTSAAGDRSIDDLVRSKLSEAGLKPSPVADRRTLVRRLYYDLLGLPPTIDEFDRWTKTDDQDWYRKLCHELLDSPHFGERMARRWMDVARYADNKGYVFREDREYPHAYRYRDWLIRSFNEDLSYQDFIRYQLVADRLDPDNKAGHLDAMGFLTLGRRFLNNKFDIIDDRIDVVSRGFLGITAACARCHDHKFDPVSTVDYYSLFGVFDNSTEPGGDPSPMRMTDRDKPVPTFVFLRGNSGNRGPKVDKQFFTFLAKDKPLPMNTGSGRLELADGIADAGNPLTARVYVNRVWGWLMGQALVDTPSDFGLRVEPPLQRELLDKLASDFVRNGWSTKKLIRAVVESDVYRQSSSADDQGLRIDPENRLLWRANRKRMDFESYRDAVLKVAGTWNPSIGGKSDIIDSPPFSTRRSLYAYIDRQNLPQIFRTFDFATPDSHVPQRSQTTVPQQGLVLMNSDMMLDILDRLFETLAVRSSPTKEEVRKLFTRLMGRVPTNIELNRMVEFLESCEASPAIVDIPTNRWSYGFGEFDVEAGQIKNFEPLRNFVAKKWIPSPEYPDKQHGYLAISEDGGHPGLSLEYLPIRRWTALSDGTIEVYGQLAHDNKNGDGVRGSLVLNRDKLLKSWTVHNKKADTKSDKIEVKTGDTLDFVVDLITGSDFDSFTWKVQLRDVASGRTFDSKVDFSGRQPTITSPWKQLAQAILMTNEFCFVD